MQRRGLTRAQQQERTRARVVAAAAGVFPRRGYHRATVDEIAAEAGLTSGAVYSNFGTKADLFLAVYEQQMTRWVDELDAAVRRGATVERRSEAAIEQWLRYLREQQDWFILFVEFWTHAIKEPALRERFARQYARLRIAISDLVADSAADLGIQLPIDASELGLAVNALGNGLLLDKLIEPEAVPEDLYGRVLDLLFSSFDAREALRIPEGWVDRHSAPG
jgi:AcrR family transcriptional regulator